MYGYNSATMLGMIVDGREMAAELQKMLKNEISHVGGQPHLTVVSCAPDFATQKYLTLKKKTAEAVGIAVNIIELPDSSTTEDVVTVVARVAIQTDGLIVQLPLPTHIDRDTVIDSIPVAVDVDGMKFAQTEDGFLPPVVAAIQEIAQQNGIVFHGQKVVVVGDGLLVGRPAAVWARRQGAEVLTITRETLNPKETTKTADILISGVGQPGLLDLEDIKPGAVLFDAGTAEDNGELKGDINPRCAEKASLYTPVPGGIGPLTVVMLLRNVLASYQQSAMMENV